MNITPIGPTSPESTSTTSEEAYVSQDEFLRLLVAQLENQDPLTPQDGTEFVAQLAQFASLEQATETNERLTSLEATQAANLRAGFANLVGRTVVARTDTFESPLGSASLAVDLPTAARSVTVSITDESGRTVRTLELGAHDAGRTDFAWDGLDDNGVPVTPGTFRMSATAVGSAGDSVPSATLITAPVQSLDFSSGQVRFHASGASFDASDIVEITVSPT